MSRDIIPHDRQALEAKLLAAFRQAEKDGRMDVAEHVLAAIEAAGRSQLSAATDAAGRPSLGSPGPSAFIR